MVQSGGGNWPGHMADQAVFASYGETTSLTQDPLVLHGKHAAGPMILGEALSSTDLAVWVLVVGAGAHSGSRFPADPCWTRLTQ